MNNIYAPLAERMRPISLDGFVGQQQLTGTGRPLRLALESGNIYSMIFWGPPGTGKTTLARIISQVSGRLFFQLSAVSSGVKEVREVIDQAGKVVRLGQPAPILFIDEIHRFNKGQQDSLLAAVEKGSLVLIGATTENPSFEVNRALLSRCEVNVLESLDVESLQYMVNQALTVDDILKEKKVYIDEWEALLRMSGGDGRKMLNGLEIIINSLGNEPIHINNVAVQEVLQKNMAAYDKAGEQHYDIISAFIKSMRGSDPNAAVYWLARMIEGGEDPLFIARRMLILASEDIGNSNPTALIMANNCFQAVQVIGYPECRIILSQTAIYLAASAKSNASYMAIEDALALVRKTGDLPVPLHIRNAPTKLMKDLGYGEDYDYAHQHKNNFSKQEYLPEGILGTTIYNPGKNAREEELRNYLKRCWGDKYGY